jgi:hypothetical protein
MALASTRYKGVPIRKRSVISIDGERLLCEQRAKSQPICSIMVFLHSNGVGTARAVPIFKTYGMDAVQVMTENGIVTSTVFTGQYLPLGRSRFQ